MGNTATIVGVHKTTGLTDTDSVVQVKAFHGNRIQVTFTPQASDGAFATIRTVIVDNVKPLLVTNSPDAPLIVTDGVNLVFSADITDADSGYTTKVNAGNDNDIEDQDNGQASVPARDTTTNAETKNGGIRLVVAGNQVNLGAGDFTKIDDGWRVSKTINSSAIQNIASNIPWYLETKDRAGNVRRTSGSISSASKTLDDTDATTTITTLRDSKFEGNLQPNSFGESSIRVTRQDASGNNVVSNAQPITAYTSTNGQFTFINTAADPLFGKAEGYLTPGDSTSGLVTPYRCPFDVPDTPDNPDTTGEDESMVNGATDPTNATLDADGAIDDAAVPQNASQLALCGALESMTADGTTTYKRSTYEILGSNLITVDSRGPTLAEADVRTGVGYNAAKKSPKAQKNSIQVIFSDPSDSNNAGDPIGVGSGLDASSVVASAFSVSGHTVESVNPVGNTVYLTLADNLGSTERPSVTIANGVIMDKAGNAFAGIRISKAADHLGPNLTLSESADLSNDKITVTITSDELLDGIPTVTVNTTEDDGTLAGSFTDKEPVSQSAVRQAGALSFTYTHSDSIGGEFSIHAMGEDTGGNAGSVGDKESASSSKAFTFELDKRLNGAVHPTVMVSDKNAAIDGAPVTKVNEVEAVDPMIVTVDFTKEGSEYKRDSYKTVTLTSAKLRITFDDGSFEDKTFNLTTEVSSPDNVKFTIPLLNPKVGSYALTVQAVDSAGNVRTDSTGATSEDLVSKWNVVAAKPVNIDLKPGWNLISLPFQPGNPAINSVIPANHPVDIVMTFDNASQVWMVSRRDAESGLFVGDIAVLTANTAYFVRTDNFEALKILRPPTATAAAAPPPPPAIPVVEGWNLVPVVTNEIPAPKGIAADDYFGTLNSGGNDGWLKALTFDTLRRTWESVTPGDRRTLTAGDNNPCTGAALNAANVEAGTESCQVGVHTNVFGDGDEDADTDTAGNQDAAGFEANDRVVLKASVTVGKGYWLYATSAGVIIP